jgi:hypothetical protein
MYTDGSDRSHSGSTIDGLPVLLEIIVILEVIVLLDMFEAFEVVWLHFILVFSW